MATEQEVLNGLIAIQTLIDKEGRDRTPAESAETLRLKQELVLIRNPLPVARVLTAAEVAKLQRLVALEAKAQISDLTAGELTDLFRNGRLR